MKSVTCIINQCNRAVFLEKSIKDQYLSGFINTEGIDFSIIVVDDGSNLDSFNRIKALCQGKVGIPLTYIFLKRRTGDYFYSDTEPMNTALMKTNADFVYFNAADCVVCSPDLFQRLSEMSPDRYLSPNFIRLHWADTIGKPWEEYFSKHWKDPEHCWKYYMDKVEKGEFTVGPKQPCQCWTARTYVVATGLFGVHRETFVSMGAYPPLRAEFGTDAAAIKKMIDNNILVDSERGLKLYVLHYHIKYDPPIAHKPNYEDRHYTTISGVSVVKDEFLDIHKMVL